MRADAHERSGVPNSLDSTTLDRLCPQSIRPGVGLKMDVFVKGADGSPFKGVVWPGVTVYPDWFAPQTPAWWTDEFKRCVLQMPS